MLVKQESPAIASYASLQFFDVGMAVFFVRVSQIHAIVMISHDGIHSVWCLKLAKVAAEAVKFRALVVDKVACEKDGIAVLLVDEVDDGLHVFLVAIAKSAYVHVRKLHDAIAVKT